MSQRAISNEQKQERQQAILETAWEMFQESDYSTVTMAGIADRLRLAKGTMYLYFPTKEELFLAMLTTQLENWFDEIDQQLETSGSMSPTQMASLIAQSLNTRPGLLRLLMILATVLEQNISFEAALAFKQMLGTHLTRTGEWIEDSLPSLPRGEGTRFLLRLNALIVGLRHMSDPAPVVQRVLSLPEMQGFVVDFETELSAMINALLKG